MAGKSQGRAPAGSQSIRRAMEVLSFVAAGKENGRRLTDVSNALGLNIATAHRLLNTLVFLGLLLQRSHDKSFVLGPELVSLAAMGHSHFILRDVFKDPMTRIAAVSEDTVFLQVLSGSETVCVARTTGSFAVPALELDVGTRLPVGVGSAGLAMLAAMPDDQCEAVLQECSPHYNSLGLKPLVVRQSIVTSRTLGYGYQVGQLTKEVAGVGVCFLDDNGIAAAVSVTALSQRLDRKRAKMIVSLIRDECSGIPGLSVFPAVLPGPASTGRLQPSQNPRVVAFKGRRPGRRG